MRGSLHIQLCNARTTLPNEPNFPRALFRKSVCSDYPRRERPTPPLSSPSGALARPSKGHLSPQGRAALIASAAGSSADRSRRSMTQRRLQESPDLLLDKLDHTTRVGAAELALGSAKGLPCRLLRSAAIEAMIHAVRSALAFAAQAQPRYAAPYFWGLGFDLLTGCSS
jgi:hypothetical protein